jgi:hypothetical protein
VLKQSKQRHALVLNCANIVCNNELDSGYIPSEAAGIRVLRARAETKQWVLYKERLFCARCITAIRHGAGDVLLTDRSGRVVQEPSTIPEDEPATREPLLASLDKKLFVVVKGEEDNDDY